MTELTAAPAQEVPLLPESPVSEASWAAFTETLRGRKITLLTGAGVSTESGIPDYRGAGTRRRTRAPIPFREFIQSAQGRQRYWARAMIGWPRMTAARPNVAHEHIAHMETGGDLVGLITQNVDRLHHKAGSQNVIELHGSLFEVKCLSCDHREERDHLQERLRSLNPGFESQKVELNPDGDTELADERITHFRPANCEACDGPLKPDVVFFGEGVPRDRVETGLQWVADADVLLVAGSSLEVFSGYRFVRRARELNKDIVVINLGPTRADEVANLKIETRVGRALGELRKRT